jgi:hypothetical protein
MHHELMAWQDVTADMTRCAELNYNETSMLLPGDPAVQGYTFTYLPWNPSNLWGQGTLHVRSYCRNPVARAGKTHLFT